jgi:hypothetical protein
MAVCTCASRASTCSSTASRGVQEWVVGQLGSEVVRVDVDVSGRVDGRTEVLNLVGRLCELAPAVVVDDWSERSGWTSAAIVADAIDDGRRLFVSPSQGDRP